MEDPEYLKELYIIGLVYKGGKMLSGTMDFPAIASAYNLRSKYDWDTADPKKPADGYLARGWHNLHSSVTKNHPKYFAEYGLFIDDLEKVREIKMKDVVNRRKRYDARKAAEKAASASATT